MILRTVEVYASYQGEGPQTGKPTIFVRFAGCNLKCPLWPCDTQHAIDPNLFRKTQVGWTPISLVDHVQTFNTRNVCLTGGEVFLQQQGPLQEFVGHLKSSGHFVECFTNGTLPIRQAFVDLEIIDSFILDWKLPGSGEHFNPAAESARHELLDRLGEDDAIKFTIASQTDYVKAKEVYKKYVEGLESPPQVYAGVVWDKLKTEELCTWMRNDDLSWNLNVQTHKFIWHPDKIGV